MRFSLRTLLLSVVILGLVVTAVFLAWENRELKKEAWWHGVLRVSDREKLNVARFENPEEAAWRWKVFIPANAKNPMLKSYVGEITSGQTPPIPGITGGIGTGAGEMEVDARIRRGMDGKWQLVVRAGGGSTNQKIEWLKPEEERLGNYSWYLEKVGVVEERVYMFLRIEKNLDETSLTKQTRPGLCVWIELDAKE